MVTKKDVADYAGVSKTTVSRVLNNNGYVSKEKREKIEKAIKELGYTPNLIARSLKTKETRQILFYVTDMLNPFYMEVYRGIEDYAVKYGYAIVVSRRFDEDVIRQRQFDGVILSGVSNEQQKRLVNIGIPAVVTDYSGLPLAIPSVGIDIQDGALMAMNCLFQHGHQNISFITSASTHSDLRYQGYVKGLEKQGISLQPELIITYKSGSSGYEQGYRAAVWLIESGRKATAVFAFNDVMAIGAMAAFLEKGYDMPREMSIIGFDDIIQSQFSYLPLTTVHIPKYEQGWESAKMLIKSIKGEEVTALTLKPGLTVRKSVYDLRTGS